MIDKTDITYLYKFQFENGEESIFEIQIDYGTADITSSPKLEYPEWTKLSYFACPHCPLDKEKTTYCPVAINLVDSIEFFKKIRSYEKVKITVTTEERNYFKETTAQEGASSLVGILMVTSGCPIMGKLKPLVRFHLPFATLDETEMRVFSIYLLAQFLKKIKGKEPDWQLTGLRKIYDNIN